MALLTGRRHALLAAGVLVGLAPPAPLAHRKLARSEPSAGTPLPALPAQVQLWCSEDPILPFSRLALTGHAAALLHTARASLALAALALVTRRC